MIREYLRYPHKTITIVFIVISAIYRAQFNLSGGIITEVSLYIVQLMHTVISVYVT